jgi:suppressor of fused
MHSSFNVNMPSFLFPGMRAIYQQLFGIYRESNPLVISTVNKVWQFPNSNEPLDYIFIYANPGSPEEEVPNHWHYISLGLSDLYGDSRVHPIDPSVSAERVSGMGFELTFRLKRHEEVTPPSWPAQLLQQLAKYVFMSRNKFYPGDHIPWQKPLDGLEDTKIRHLLIALDCQLKKIKTVLGHVSFCQIVGVTEEELNRAQSFNVKGILNLLRNDPKTGGISLVTDTRRMLSVFDLFPQTVKMLEDDLEREGSDLAGIDAEFFYRELPKIAIKTSLCLTMSDSDKSLDFTRHLGRLDIRTSAELNAHHSSSPFLPFSRRMPLILDGLEIIFSPTTAKFLKLAFKDRLRHGHHFTFQNPDTHLTLVAENVQGCFVTKDQPYAMNGKWLQLRIDKDLLETVIESLKDFEPDKIVSMQLPLVFDYPDKNLRFIVNHLSPTSMIH